MTRLGKQTMVFKNKPGIWSSASVAGPKEGKGPFGKAFDEVAEDPMMNRKSYEMAEYQMLLRACEMCMKKSSLKKENVQAFLGGDLQNQIMSASLTARALEIPFFGLYGACSAMTESMLLGCTLADSGFADPVLCAAGSHFCTAERQYRFPLEYACQRPSSAQWTVTGAGACIIGKNRGKVCIPMGTVGRVMDLGIKDASHMGAAMAPAAADTLISHLSDTGRTLEDYDFVITGDLGKIGSRLLYDLLKKRNIILNENKHMDCGVKIFDESQNVDAGGSGCGCAASMLSAWILPNLYDKIWNRILFMATGALLSPAINQQGESIPGIGHLIVLERRGEDDLS